MKGVDFADCKAIEFVSFGPLEEEVKSLKDHKPPRDRTHALERDLCEGMINEGYKIMNKVGCKLESGAVGVCRAI
jgi:hypothetical protein